MWETHEKVAAAGACRYTLFHQIVYAEFNDGTYRAKEGLVSYDIDSTIISI